MDLTIHLSQDLEARLSEAARECNMEPGQYIERLLEMSLPVKGRGYGFMRHTLSKEEWLETFWRWIESHDDVDAPPLPDEALRRENLYEDRL